MMTMNADRNNPDETKLEQDLRAIRARWRSDGADEPPGLLDQAVLNAARRELQGKTGPRRLRWLGGFATAVVVVVAVSLVLQQQQSEGPAPGLPDGDGFRLEAEPPTESRTAVSKERAAVEAEQRRDEAATAAALEPGEPPPGAASPQAVPRAAAAPLGESFDAPEKADSAEADADAATEWVERLLDLQRSGDEERLAEELAAFRRAYPDYPLPPELE